MNLGGGKVGRKEDLGSRKNQRRTSTMKWARTAI
jgi:hypothetical protein